MTSSEYRLIDTPTIRWIATILLSGIALLGVLPFGMMNILHPFIPFFSIFHIGTLFIAATVGLVYLYRLTTACRWPPLFTWCAIAVPLIAVILLGRLPVTDPTALSRYLAIPKWWLDSGAIVPFLWYAPSLEQSLVGLAFLELLNNDALRLVPLYLSLYLICIAALTARVVEHRTHRKESACLAFLLTLTVPIALRCVTVPWPNVPAALFIGLALVLIIGWLEEDRRRGLLALAGIALGLGVGCSWVSSIAFLAILPAFLCAARSKAVAWWRIVGSVILLSSGTVILLAPWLIRNGLWLSNPFYPVGGDILGTNSLIAGGRSSIELASSLINLGKRWQELVVSPFTIAFFSTDGSVGGYDGMTSPLFAMALIPLWSYRKHPAIIFLGIFLLLFLLFAALGQLVELRDFLPMLLPVTALAILGIGSIGRLFKRRYERAVVGFLVTAQIVSCAVYVVDRVNRLGALNPELETTAYLRENLEDYRLIEVINSTVPPTEYIYDLFAASSFFYLSPRAMTGGLEQVAQIADWLRTSSSPRILAKEFLNRGIRFLACNDPVLSRALGERLTEREWKLWEDFTRSNLVELATIDSRRLFRIEP